MLHRSTARRLLVTALSIYTLLDVVTAQQSSLPGNTATLASGSASLPPRWLNTTSLSFTPSTQTSASAASNSNQQSRASISSRLTATAGRAPASTGLSQNGTQNGTIDDCYAQWMDYWSSSSMHIHGTPSSSPVSTYTDTFTDGGSPARTVTFSYAPQTETITVFDGGFAVATETTTDSAGAWTRTDASEPLSFETYTFTDYTLMYPPMPTVPGCSIPPINKNCQSTWESVLATQLQPSPLPPHDCDVYAGYSFNSLGVAAYTVPACASQYFSSSATWQSNVYMASTPACQAFSVSGSLCQSVRDNWQLGQNGMFAPSYSPTWRRQIFSHGSIWVPRTTTADWEWFTSSTLGIASGCTLGCGRCEVTGGTVQLIYWPDTSQTAMPSRASPAPAIVTAVTLGTTFTSPTLYISYAGVFAQDACSTVGTSLSATILAIPTQSQLSSIYGNMQACGVVGDDYHVDIWTAPFTAADMKEPVPYSIYQSQPFCQEYKANGYCNGTCPTTAPYRPILVVPDRVYRELQPAWADCWGDVHGVYDPPIALTGISVAASITMTGNNDPTPTPASPSPPGLNRPAVSTSVASSTAVVQDPPQTRDPTKTTVTLSSATITIAQGTSSALIISAEGQVTTISNGAVATIAGQRVSAALGNAVVLDPGSAAVTVDAPAQTIATLGGQTITFSRAADDPAGIVVAQGTSATTLLPGMGAVTIAGQQMSVAAGGTILVASKSSTHTVTVAASPSNFVVGGQAVTMLADPTGAVIVDQGVSKTYTAGATMTVEGQQIIVGSGIIIMGTVPSATTISLPGARGGQTSLLLETQAVAISRLADGVLIGDRSITTKLIVGSEATIEGQRVSIGTNGVVVIGTGISASTIALTSDVSPSATSRLRYTGAGSSVRAQSSFAVTTSILIASIFLLSIS